MSDSGQRFHSLDAVRACALLAGIVLHATMAFLPGFGDLRWPIIDKSTSDTLGLTFFVIHIFRMALFFIIAGFFARLLHQRLGTGGLIKNRLRRIGLPFVAAMVLVMPFTIIAIVWAVRQGVPGAAAGGPPAMAAAPVIGPPIPLGHLWFLYLLLVLLALWLLVRVLLVHFFDEARREAFSRAAASVIGSGLSPLVLAIPVAATLLAAKWWLAWHGIPAPVAGLLPNFPALVAFGGAFLLGWAMHRAQSTLTSLAANWWLYLGVAALATLAAIFVAGDRIHFSLQPLGDFERVAFAVAYALAMWCWCFGLIGAAVRFLDRPSPRWRYLADASYWMYLVHLPLVWLLQAWMLKWPLHWTVKFPLILAITLTMLLASYHWMVRPTFVGVFLNGRRYPRSTALATSAPSTSPG